jgi:hypothetical protein
MPKPEQPTKSIVLDSSARHDGHGAVLRKLGATTFLVLHNRWLNVSRIEEMAIEDDTFTVKLMTGQVMDFKCDTEELADLLEHGWED